MTSVPAPAFSVRRPRAGDWPQVMELLRSANFHHIGGAEMRRFVPEDCFVAELEGRVVGVAGYAILDAVTAKTTLMVVDASARRLGVGTALQQHRLAYLRQRGIRVLYTNCDDPAVVAWNCRHFGYRPTGRLIPKLEAYGRADKDAWVNLRLELDPDSRAMQPRLPASADPGEGVHDLTGSHGDAALWAAVNGVVRAMRRDQERLLAERFRPDPAASEVVAAEALTPLLAGKAWVSDIVEERGLSNCLAYNFGNVAGAVMDEDLAALRQEVDRRVLDLARDLFPGFPGLTVENTGHFWYPPGGYMGWHTNLRTPGWRCYLSRADVPGRSFFRYREPRDGRIVTAWDRGLDIRLFPIDPAAPLWHAVYSDTHRFSLGYKFILV